MVASKGKMRASIFAGVFGLICILMTLFVSYMFTIEIITSMMSVAMIIVAVLTMWMVYIGVFVTLLALSDLEDKTTTIQ